MLKYKITTQPTVEPITTAEAKLHCRVTDTTDDAKFADLIVAAREYAEAVTGQAFAVQTITAACDYFPRENCIELPKGPIVSLTSLICTDADSNAQDITTDVAIDDFSIKPRLVLKPVKSWPSATLYPVNAIKIIYVAGAAPSKHIKAAMLLLIGHWYENREEVVIGQESFTVPMAAEAILQQNRHTTT